MSIQDSMIPTNSVIWLQQQGARLAADFAARRIRIQHARTMREIAQQSDTHVRPELRFLPNVRNAQLQLQQAAEHRMEQVLDVQLRELGACATEDDLKREISELSRNHWPYLRGRFAKLFQKATLAARRALHHRQGSRPGFAGEPDEEESGPSL